MHSLKLLRNTKTGSIMAFTAQLAELKFMVPYNDPELATPKDVRTEASAPGDTPDWTQFTDKGDLAKYAIDTHGVTLDQRMTLVNMQAAFTAALAAESAALIAAAATGLSEPAPDPEAAAVAKPAE